MDERAEVGAMTTGQVADAIGIDRRTVWSIATKHGIGRAVTARLRLFTPADVERIRALTHYKPGRPAQPRPDPNSGTAGHAPTPDTAPDRPPRRRAAPDHGV